MPTYDYFCPKNGRDVSVFHSMGSRIETWGELCEAAALDAGETPADTPVERKIGTGIVMTRQPHQLSGFGGGGGGTCCGTHGCGD